MEDCPYLIFSLHNSLYGINTTNVDEIFFLPELTPIPEAPTDIVGVVNIRGEIMPIMDLNLRFGYRTTNYQITDSVIVVQAENGRVGIIVNAVHEVKNLANAEITKELAYGREQELEGKRIFSSGIARSESDIIVLLNVNKIISYVEHQTEVNLTENRQDQEQLQDQHRADNGYHQPQSYRVFAPHATPEEQATFRKRAESLRQITDSEEVTGLKPLAVVLLNKEFFGIDLKLVREFTDIHKVTPIPCSPSHIIGNMNLRGEVLTLVDIGGLLNLPIKGTAQEQKAMVIEVGDIVAGIAVETVCDVTFLNPAAITTVPTAIHSINDEYLEGAAPYEGKMMSILDLEKILVGGGLVVDESL